MVIVRTRPVQACRQCRASKAKCDKAKPKCSQCIFRSRGCLYDDKAAIDHARETVQPASPPFRRSERVESSPQRASLPECCENYHCGKTAESHPGRLERKSWTRNRIPKSCNRCHQLKVKCDRQMPCSRCVQQRREKDCVYGGQLPSSQSRSQDYTSFYATTHWMTVSKNIETILGGNICPGHCYTTKEFPKGDEASYDVPFGMLISPSVSPITSRKMILAMLPAGATADELVGLFFQTMNKVYNILHYTAFAKEIALYRRDPGAVDISWLALLCAVTSQGLLLRQESGGNSAITNSDDKGLAEKLLRAARDCIFQTSLMARPTIAAIQCLCIITTSGHLAPFSCRDTDSGWVMTGTIVKLAYSLCLHNSRIVPNLTKWELERREMLWSAIVHLELRQSLTSGKPTMLRLRDLDELQQVPYLPRCEPRVSPLPTIAAVLDEKISASSSLSHDYIVRYDYELHQMLRQADETYAVDPESEALHPEHIAFTALIRRSRLALHYPASFEPNAHLHYAEGYWASLECCLGLLALQRTLHERDHKFSCSWLAKIFKEDFYTAALTLCQHLLEGEAPMDTTSLSGQADPAPSSGLQAHPRETVMETLRSCREIWHRERNLSFCQTMAYNVFNGVLEKIEEVGNIDL